MGSLSVASPLLLPEALAAWEQQETARKATPWNELGPFYKRHAPASPHLRGPHDPGVPVAVSGQVFDTRGTPVEGARVEIWHASHQGRYDLEGYRYRAALAADRAGKYAFDSVIPGHYPGRVCQHIHYSVTAPGHKPLITQLYFATDTVFDGDPDRNYTKDPLIGSRELVRPVMIRGDAKAIQALVTFELVLERL